MPEPTTGRPAPAPGAVTGERHWRRRFRDERASGCRSGRGRSASILCRDLHQVRPDRRIGECRRSRLEQTARRRVALARVPGCPRRGERPGRDPRRSRGRAHPGDPRRGGPPAAPHGVGERLISTRCRARRTTRAHHPCGIVSRRRLVPLAAHHAYGERQSACTLAYECPVLADWRSRSAVVGLIVGLQVPLKLSATVQLDP